MAIKTVKYFSLVFFILLFFTNISNSQINTVVINEQFNDNSNNWDVHDEPQ